MLDLALLRNRVLVGSTVAILIGAGTINALMYLLSLYFQDPAALGFTRSKPVSPPCRPRSGSSSWRRSSPGWRRSSVVGPWSAPGSRSPPSDSRSSGSTRASWGYAAFVLPLIAVAVGMGLSNGPASSAATAAVPANQVGEASGVSNMARYVGAAVATALAASIFSSVIGRQTAAGAEPAEALSAGLGTASWVMAVFSAAGVLMAVVMGRHRPPRAPSTTPPRPPRRSATPCPRPRPRLPTRRPRVATASWRKCR